jgi:hypothetical protein
MSNPGSLDKGSVLAALAGAVIGGLVVAVATEAIPKIMSGIMRTMIAQMKESGCNPTEM